MMCPSTRCKYANGDRYEGCWLQGLPGGGSGSMLYSNGEKYTGEWSRGRFVCLLNNLVYVLRSVA